MLRNRPLLAACLALPFLAAASNAATPPDITFYGRAASSSIRYIQWNGTVWSASGAGSNVSAAPDWVRAAGCPTRAESVVVTIDAARATRVFHHIGIYCYSTTLLTSSAGNAGRSADVVYEQSTSDALIAYWNGSASNVCWRTSTNGTLSSVSQLALPSTNAVTFLRLVPVPGGEQVLLLALNNNRCLYACQWSGSAWGSVTTISSDASASDAECFAAAFERRSGDGLLVYSTASTNAVMYRTLTGGAWSSEQTGPAISTTFSWASLTSKASSDMLLLGLQDTAKGVSVGFWNGSSWGALTTCTSDSGSDQARHFDVAWEPGGVNAVVAYAKNGQSRVFVRSWNGAAWSGETDGPATTSQARVVRLVRGASGGTVHAVWSDGASDLYTSQWNGTVFSSPSLVDANVSGTATTEPFSVILPASDGAARGRVVRWRETSAN